MKKNSKKRFKEKIKVTLKILVLFVIVKNIGYSEENLQDIEMGIEIKNKSNEVIDVSDINHGAYKEVNGLKIENSENISVNIDEINTILNKKTGTISSVLYGKGLINDTSEVYMSDELKINVTTEELEGNTTSLVGVTNGGKLIFGENTKINIAANGNVASNSITYGVYLNGTSLTHFGRGSEINVSASAGFVAGISTNFSEINDNYGIVIGDNVKIKAEVTNAVSGNNNQALGIYSVTGNTVTIGNDLIIETEINLFNGATGGSYAIKNVKNGKMIIGNNAILSTKGNNATSQSAIYNNTNSNFEIGNGAKITSVLNSENQKNSAYTVYNSGNSTMNIGTDSEINVKGSNARQVSAVYNGLSSELVIEDKSIITAWAENTNFLMGLYNNSGGKMRIGNEGKITSIFNSKNQENTAHSVYNMKGSMLNIGKNSEINVIGKDANQISAVCNRDSSSELIIEDGGTITASGENTNFIMGLYNMNEGKMKIGNEGKITSIIDSKDQKNSAYSVYNTGNSTLNIGKNSEINVMGKGARQISAVYNNGASSELIIEEGGTITASGENTVFVMGLYSENSGSIKIGDRVKIISSLDSIGQENNVFGISNTKNSTLNIGEKAEISAVGKDANQVVAVYNGGSSSKLTIENGSIITASGLGNNNIIGAVWNEEGNIKLNGGTSIYSDRYAVYNENGSVSIEDEGYSKKIQGDIFSTKAGAVTDILLDTDDSYLEGASFKNNGGIFNFGLKNSAVWYVPKNSEVTNFDIENGIVDMTQNYSGETIKGKQVISIDKISGSGGTYIMDISPEDRDQTGDKTDGINIEKADAAQKNYIQAGKTSITGLVNHNFSDKENSSIKIASADKNVTFEGTKFTDTASIYDYVLSLEENIKGEAGEKNTWYVTGVEKQEGEVIKNIETAITLNYMSAVSSRSELNSVHKRLGEIHNGTSENGTWAGTSSVQMEHNKSSEKFKNEYNALQIGYDKRKETEKRSVFTGFAVHKKEGKTDFKNGDGKNYDIGISLYKSFVMEDNSYANLVVKYSYINNEHKNYTSDMQEMKTDYDTWSGSISFEYGKKYTKNSWYMIPQMQMDYTFVKGADYAMNSGIKVEQKNINSLVGRAGMYAGYDFERSSHFIKTGILQEFSGDYGARITGIDTTVNKKYKGKDTWLEAGIGGYFEVGKTGTTNIYYNIEKTFGSKFERNWQVSLGLRIKF
ncbi:autotransporter outer membrane beta-barrel domain-containing protein [Fusobacterium ulcerans]|uniref:autotransporter outer membrane beta-barrel domain-containing protein n=1 Tax=Fusobacterium ulcerans TaxID=861 RepID=UPI0026F13DBD|nr:autotransporter outer membrane beta-barrel domain-containing protein [Fusobacterium ulcerans]